MTAPKVFVDEICEYIASKTDFYYGDSLTLPGGKNRWLYLGELRREVEGVFAVADPSPAPDMYTGMMEFAVSFWAFSADTSEAYSMLNDIYNLLHQNNHYPTENYFVYQSFADGQVEDQDRSGDNLKMARLSAIFYVRYLIS